MNTIPISDNIGKGVERIEMKCRGNKYDTQFTNTEKKKNNLCIT